MKLHSSISDRQLYEINQKTLHLGLPSSHWLKACASGQNWVFWKKHHEMTASGKGCTTCFWLFTLPGIDAEHRLPSWHHHQDQTLPKAKAGSDGLWSRSKQLQSRLTTQDQRNRNYDLGVDETDLIVVNVLFSKGHMRKSFSSLIYP